MLGSPGVVALEAERSAAFSLQSPLSDHGAITAETSPLQAEAPRLLVARTR
jgi:hypothetical protein